MSDPDEAEHSDHPVGRLLAPMAKPTESSRANSRAALVEAAFEEFSSKGYEAATVAGIAERAGVTTGALYAHFTGKLDVLLATVGLTSLEDIVRSVEDIAARPWNDASRALRQGMASPPDRRVVLLLDVIVVARRDPHVAQVLRRGLEAYFGAVARATEAAAARGLMEPGLATEDLTRMFALLSLGKMVFAALGEQPPSEAAFSRLADLLLQSTDGGDEPAALARVRLRAAALDEAQAALHDEIVQAIGEGHSLRQVGAAADLSHERVRQVLRERADTE